MIPRLHPDDFVSARDESIRIINEVDGEYDKIKDVAFSEYVFYNLEKYFCTKNIDMSICNAFKYGETGICLVEKKEGVIMTPVEENTRENFIIVLPIEDIRSNLEEILLETKSYHPEWHRYILDVLIKKNALRTGIGYYELTGLSLGIRRSHGGIPDDICFITVTVNINQAICSAIENYCGTKITADCNWALDVVDENCLTAIQTRASLWLAP